jgi:hypothetical protein
MRDTIDMAREAGIELDLIDEDEGRIWYITTEGIKAFEALVRADEREQAIALQQHEDVLAPIGHSAWGEAYQEGWAEGTAAYRDAIRARGNT